MPATVNKKAGANAIGPLGALPSSEVSLQALHSDRPAQVAKAAGLLPAKSKGVHLGLPGEANGIFLSGSDNSVGFGRGTEWFW